jgi:hypothetical protein
MASLLFQSHGFDFSPQAFAEVLFVYPTIWQSPRQVKVLMTVLTFFPCHFGLHPNRLPVIEILKLTHLTRCCIQNE